MDSTFFGLYRPLSQQHRVVAFDQRGHGSSTAQVQRHRIEDLVDDAVMVLDALEISQVIVAGYSLGGAMAMQMAYRHPDRVAGISVHGACLQYRQVFRDRLVWPTLALSGRLPRAGVATFATQQLLNGYRTDRGFEERLPWMLDELARTSDAAIVSTGAAVSRYDMRRRAAEIRCPASVLIPRGDAIALPWLQTRAAEELRASVTLVDGDHHLPLAWPDRYAEAALGAIGDVASRL